MSKSKSLIDRIKSVGKFVGRKVILPTAMVTAGVLYSQNADAQIKSDYKNHDKGAKFREYTAKSNDLLEEKVYYNAVTKKEERFYVQNLDKNLYENDLNKALLPFYNTMPIMDMKTGDVSYLVADTAYALFPIKEKSLEITASHVPDRCDDQIREIADVQKGVNYISTSYVKDYFKKLSKDMVLELEDGKSFLILTLPRDKQVKGKTNQLYIPLDDEHHWGVDPKTKKLWGFGDIYQGSLITDKDGTASKVGVSGSTGLASKLGEKDTFAETVEEAGKKEAKVAKDSTKTKNNLYLIFGGNGNNKFIEGDFGVQYGPLALVGNLGRAKDENVKDFKTANFPDGTYGYGKEDNLNINVKGIAFEIHPLYNKRISPFAGVGINNWNYNTNELAQIKAPNGDVLSSNFDIQSNSENSWKVYGGTNLGRNSKLGILAGYDSKSKGFAGARYSVKFGGQKK